MSLNWETNLKCSAEGVHMFGCVCPLKLMFCLKKWLSPWLLLRIISPCHVCSSCCLLSRVCWILGAGRFGYSLRRNLVRCCGYCGYCGVLTYVVLVEAVCLGMVLGLAGEVLLGDLNAPLCAGADVV